MTSETNVQVVLASRPQGEPTPENFKIVEAAVPEAGPGQMLLRTIYLSLDPYMRGRMSAGPSYATPVEVGGVMEGGAVSEVVNSNLPGYAAQGHRGRADRLAEVLAVGWPGCTEGRPQAADRSRTHWACSGCRVSPLTRAC